MADEAELITDAARLALVTGSATCLRTPTGHLREAGSKGDRGAQR